MRKRFAILSYAAMAAFLACLPSVQCSAAAPATIAETTTDFTTVASEAIPAVVSIKVREMAKSKHSSDVDSFFNDPFWQRFFSSPEDHPHEQIGQASGFIVSADGYILTSGHVVENTNEIIVTLDDGREFPAKAIGQDNNTDIALIKIEASDLPHLTLGNSDNLKVGQWVVAVGTPLGLKASLTAGVISAKGRNNLDLTRIEDFIQTDAALNRGNSGGPLLNLQGQVIGVNTAIASSMGGNMGIGFAVPSNIARSVMEQLLAKGSVSRGFIGVVLQPIDQNLAASFGLKKPEGILVAQVSKDSPAEKAGISQGDIIVKYNDTLVNNVGSLRTAIALMPPGSKINVSLLRNGKLLEVKDLVIGELADAKPSKATVQENKLGITVDNLTSDIVRALGLHDDKGVVITKVEPKSIGGWAGLRKGMVILEINKNKVENVAQFQQILKDADKEKPILFLIKEGNAVRFVSFKMN